MILSVRGMDQCLLHTPHQYRARARETNDPAKDSVMNPRHVLPEAHCAYAKKKMGGIIKHV